MIFLAIPCHAKGLKQGYRGFVEWDNNLGYQHYIENGTQEYAHDFNWYIGISTSHGYQINQNVFVGAGALLTVSPSDIYLPVFADIRYDTTFGKFTPFGDIRIGYALFECFYFSPTIGYRISCGRKANFNLGLGLSVFGNANKKRVWKEINSGDETIHYSEQKDYPACFFTVRLGFDF